MSPILARSASLRCRGEQLENLEGDHGQPRDQHVGVGVVPQALFVRVVVLLVELVWAHDAVDLVPVALRVEVGDGGPEAGDVEHHLGAVVEQELQVIGRLVVAPDVVEDIRADVALVVAQVRLPLTRLGVDVHLLGLFLAVRAALPGEHRPLVACLSGRRAGLVHAPVAVHQELARYLGQPEVEERIDIELVPEDVPAVGLAVQAPGRDAGVEVGGVRRADLEDVRDVQPEQELDPIVFRDPHVAELPELVPRPRVALEGLLERPVPANGLPGVDQRLVYGGVARGVERDHLLHVHRLLLPDLEGEHLVDVVLHLVEAAIRVEPCPVAVDAGAGRLGDVEVRLSRSHLQGDNLGAERPRGHRVEVSPFQLSVTGHAPVRDPTVER